MNKISVPCSVFREKKNNDLSETRLNVNKGMRFASGTLKSASLILMGVNKYANTFLMASCNKKTCNQRKKRRKYTIVFTSTQLRITRWRKYPIDPKVYLGRCTQMVFLK